MVIDQLANREIGQMIHHLSNCPIGHGFNHLCINDNLFVGNKIWKIFTNPLIADPTICLGSDL